jgi:hypothetical protein
MAKKTTDTPAETTPDTDVAIAAQNALVEALARAINLTKPIEKKNIMNRKPGDPWTPKDGSKKLKLKRKAYQHGIIVDPDFITNEEIDLFNKLRPGRFLDGWVKVYKRRDGGIDIDYPVKTATQRMKLLSSYRITSLKDLLTKCIEEAKNPKPETSADTED